MGFKDPTYKVEFDEDHEYAGLWVRFTGLPVDVVLKMQALTAKKQEELEETEISFLVDAFADALKAWSWEDENDVTYPTDRETVAKRDFSVVFTIITEWTNAVIGVKDALKKDSKPTGTFPVAQIPMEPLTQNHQN